MILGTNLSFRIRTTDNRIKSCGELDPHTVYNENLQELLLVGNSSTLIANYRYRIYLPYKSPFILYKSMKVIDHAGIPQNVTFLPQEVLSLVVAYVRANRSTRAAQHDVWACCLVGRTWYDAAIEQLYRAPFLSPRNFSHFANIVSGSVTSRRRVGLEDFVEYLDMGSLAYESKKSLTSRLISRTKVSLRSFVAPAVSFSTTSLAPLSKCTKLELLDLSRDVYDFDFKRLMSSIGALSLLRWLSLPKDCGLFVAAFENQDRDGRNVPVWPPNLKFIQINESYALPNGTTWTSLLHGLPSGLQSLSFRGLTVFDPFDSIGQAEIELITVTDLTIGVSRSDDTYYFNHMCKPFPNLTKITVPAMTSWVLKSFLFTSQDSTWSISSNDHQPGQLKPPQKLEILILEESPDFPTSSHIRLTDLKQFVDLCPKLMRIDVPEAYLSIDEEDDAALDELNDVLGKRVKDLNGGRRRLSIESAGIFMTERPHDTGVGMKRSFRYRGGN